jgi:hypothetical protein
MLQTLNFDLCFNIKAVNISKIYTGKGKGKVVPALLTEHHPMMAYWGSRGIPLRIPDLGTMWEVSGQLHAPAALPPGKVLLIPIGVLTS